MPERNEEAVGHELNVFRHKVTVHADEIAGQRFANEFPFRSDRAPNDVMHNILGQTILEHAVDHGRKVSMQAFIPGNQLVGKMSSQASDLVSSANKLRRMIH